MKSKGIKNLLIDLGGILVSPDRERCIKNFKKIEFQNIEEKFCTHQLDGIFLQQEKELITPAKLRDGIRGMMGKVVSGKQIDTTWNGFSVDIPTYGLDLLLKLHERCVVYLFSNTSDVHWKWVCKSAFLYRTLKVEGYFEETYLPCEVKMTKPKPEIFKAMTEDTGTDPKETFFIDDSEISCKVTQELGISTYTPKAGEDWSHPSRKK